MEPIAALVLLAAPLASPQCPGWSPDYPSGGPNGSVTTQLVLPRGAEEVLLIAGTFDHVAGTPAPGLAYWDGQGVTPFPAAAPGTVRSLAVADLGMGPALYAAGDGFFGRWTGSSWEVLATHALATDLTFVGGSAPALFYLTVEGRLMRFDGTVTEIANVASLDGFPTALAAHDTGIGPALHVGGSFGTIGTRREGVLRFDGAAFAPTGLVIPEGSGGSVTALISYTTPAGTRELHALGTAAIASGSPLISGWFALETPLWRQLSTTQVPRGFATRNTSAGDELVVLNSDGTLLLYAGAAVQTETIDPADFVLSTPLAPGSVTAFGGAIPQDLYVAQAGATLNGSSLLRIGPGGPTGLFPVNAFERPGTALAVHDFGAGPEAVLFGARRSEDRSRASRYDGSTWRPVAGSPIEGGVISSAVSLGGDLFVTGRELRGQVAPSVPGPATQGFRVARLTPDGFVPLRSASPLGSNGFENALAVLDGELYSGGFVVNNFPFSPPRGLARWTGTDWEPVGPGFTGPPVGSAMGVGAMTVWNDGSGDALYVAGVFREAGGIEVNHIARWDGQSWSALGTGFPGVFPPLISGMCGWNSPSGPMLVVAGAFASVDGVPTNSIAGWDGASWHDLGSGPAAAPPAVLRTLAVHDPDGRGERLLIAGEFTTFAGMPARRVAEFDGSSWREADLPRKAGPGSSPIAAMVSGDFGNGRELIVTGPFDRAPGQLSHRVGIRRDACGDILGDPVCPALPTSTGGIALTRARGSAAIATNDLILEARGLPPFQTALAFAGTAVAVEPAGDGLRCVGGTVTRLTPVATSDAGGEVTIPVGLTGASLAGSAMAGTTLVFQTFFRDTGPAGFATTDALAVHLR